MSNPVLEQLLADLAAEGDRLRSTVAGLDDSADGGWRTPTPAEGWDVATQVAHLTWTDEAAVLAARAATGDKDAWDALVMGALEDPEGFVDKGAVAIAESLPEDLLVRWDAGRAALTEALRSADGKLPWFGPPMSPASMATARLMETWAHAHDVYDALGIEPVVTDAVKHVCHLGIRTRGFSYAAHGLEAPTADVRVELVGPGGALWAWGPDSAPQRVSGPAYDFARLVTQRVHRDDTALVAEGEDAEQWLRIAQAFAGPPGKGREPRG